MKTECVHRQERNEITWQNLERFKKVTRSHAIEESHLTYTTNAADNTHKHSS